MWALYTAVAAHAINTIASPALLDFLPFRLVYVCKLSDLFTLTLCSLEQFASLYKDYGHLLIEKKTEFKAGIWLDYKTKPAKDRIPHTSM